jgi:hypothetical protein
MCRPYVRENRLGNVRIWTAETKYVGTFPQINRLLNVLYTNSEAIMSGICHIVNSSEEDNEEVKFKVEYN